MSRKITTLQIQKKNPNRVNVFLDGEFAFGLFRVVAAWLQVGQELSEEKIRQLTQAEAEEKAYQRALNFLSYRARSEDEIRRNLRKHDTPDELIETVLKRLRRNRLVDDEAFARSWVENRCEFRPRGRRALRSELRRKGLDDQVIAAVLQELDEEELAYKAARQKAHAYRKLEWPEFRKKMLGFLSRRGFSYGIAAPAVEQVWAEEQETS